MEPKIRNILMWAGIVCLCFVGIPIHLKGEDQEMLELTFKNYTKTFGKVYDEQSFKERLPQFQKSLLRIAELNERDDQAIGNSASPKPNLKLSSGNERSDNDKQSSSHQHIHKKRWKPGTPKNEGYALWGLTQFSDLSPAEFQVKYLNPSIIKKITERENSSNKAPHYHRHSFEHKEATNGKLRTRRRRALSISGPLPEKVDWREKGVVSAVRNQGSCGACWALSTVETVESMYAIQNGTLVSLSVQQVIDCATNGNLGCEGGDTCSAIEWMTGVKLVTEAEYPLTLENQTCKMRHPSHGVQVNGNYTCVNYIGAEDDLLTVLAHHGPVAAAVDATNWQFYAGGIIQWNCDANNNHAVEIVGYDNTATIPHYIVRNSWGPDFGDNGYLYIAIGSNLCGLAREVSSLSVKL